MTQQIHFFSLSNGNSIKNALYDLNICWVQALNTNIQRLMFISGVVQVQMIFKDLNVWNSLELLDLAAELSWQFQAKYLHFPTLLNPGIHPKKTSFYLNT